MQSTDQSSEQFMLEALQEGRKAREICAPNPPVGCVLVRDGGIVSRGHTNKPGEYHAEAMALANLDDKSGAIAYVTLEPCSFQGRTPSCAQALIDSGIRQVFVSLLDPDPRNNGTGIKMLEDAGIEVAVGLLADQARKDLSPYLAES